MAIWYCGSVQYLAVPQWAATTAYTVGQFVRNLATPSVGQDRVWRCTTAGTSGATEPSWFNSRGGTTTSGTVTFTEVTGNVAYGWSAPHRNIGNAITASQGIPDTIVVAKNHTWTYTANPTWDTFSSNVMIHIVCVDHAGSVPPVGADVTTGAIETSTGHFDINGPISITGITLVAPGSGNLHFNQNRASEYMLDDVTLILSGANSSQRIYVQYISANGDSRCATWKNVTVKFSHASQSIVYGPITWSWIGGGIDAAGTVPNTLFTRNGGGGFCTFSGLDLSILSTQPIIGSDASNSYIQFLNCRLPTGYVLYTTQTSTMTSMKVDMIICDSGVGNYKHERHNYFGDMTTETTNVRSGGANDSIRGYSWKVATNTRTTVRTPFDLFSGVVWNATTGAAKTLTLEILSSGTLKDTDVALEVEHLGSSASPKSSIATSAPVGSVIAAGSNLPTSSATWTTTGIGTPVAQKISATFTPQMVGYVRWRARIFKPSALVWIDPAPVLT